MAWGNGVTTDGIYESLFDRIIGGQYKAGTWLREDALAHEFGVSRTPVRNVLGLLAQDGLVEFMPKRGSRSLGFTVDDLEEAYEIRRTLELLALDRAIATISIGELMSIRSDIVSLSESTDSHTHAEIDARLHSFIARSSKGIRIEATLGRLFRIMQRFRELGFQDIGIQNLATEEHLHIIDSVAARDSEKAKEALSDHVKKSKARVLSKIIQGNLDQV